jgi:hypothetical protein
MTKGDNFLFELKNKLIVFFVSLLNAISDNEIALNDFTLKAITFCFQN